MGSYPFRSSRLSKRYPYGDQNTPPPPPSAANLGYQNTPSNPRPATLSTFQPTNQPTVSPSSVNLSPSPESMEEIQNLPEAPSIPKSRRLPKRPAPPTPAHMLAPSISGPPSLAEMEQIYEQARTNPYGHQSMTVTADQSMTVTADVNAMTVTAEVNSTHD